MDGKLFWRPQPCHSRLFRTDAMDGQEFKTFIENADMFSINLKGQGKGKIEAVYVSSSIRANFDQGFPQDVDERPVKLSFVDDIDTSSVDRSACDEKPGVLFSVVPYCLIVIKEGIIPPKYILPVPSPDRMRIRTDGHVLRNLCLALVLYMSSRKPGAETAANLWFEHAVLFRH